MIHLNIQKPREYTLKLICVCVLCVCVKSLSCVQLFATP